MIRRRLRAFQRRIERRLDRENKKTTDDGRPVLRGIDAPYEIATRIRSVAAGGVALIHRMVQALKLDLEIDKRLHLLKCHQPYHESDHVTNIAYNLLAGGRCLEDLEVRRNDEHYLDTLGARRIPDPTTAGDFCRRFSTDSVDALQDAINERRIVVWQTQPEPFFEHALIDADGSLVEASDCSEGADFTYKRTFGYHPLIVSLANTQEVLLLENRPGSRPSYEGAAARLDQAVDLVRRAGFRSVTLRGDTDFSQTTFLDGWDSRDVNFVFGYDARAGLVKKASSLAQSAWFPLERGNRYTIRTKPRSRPENVRERMVVKREYRNIHLEQEHVAEFEHTPSACKKAYRMVVVRKTLTHKRGEKLLFPETRYFFYITNKRGITAREVVRLANTRCDQERLIGQLRSDVRALCCPLDNLHSNWAYMVIATLAWNLTKWFALLLPESGRWAEKHADEKSRVLRMNFHTFVTAFMRVPAQIISTGRRIVLRLLAWNRWQPIFFRALYAVHAFP
jgi:hypothetical protein